MRISENVNVPLPTPGWMRVWLYDILRAIIRAHNWLYGAADIGGGGVVSVSANTTLDDDNTCAVVTASGKTITLPPCTDERVGRKWTVILAAAGWVDVTRSGSDVIKIDGGISTARLDNYGATLTLRCLSASTWGAV